MSSSQAAAAAASSSFQASSSSWSPEEIDSASSFRSADPARVAAVEGRAPLSAALAEGFASSLCTQDEVDALCRRYGIPREFAALPAGDRRACTPPPPGAVCVYAHALEAGMRVPLHGFFCEVLSHFGLAPSQLLPNGWRIMAGFVVLCHFIGVAPSMGVFRHFFTLSISKLKGSYFFRGKDAAGALFTGLPQSIKDWKRGYFFLSSPTPWPCPVEWGKPSKSSTTEPVLTAEEKKLAAELLRANGGAVVDLKTYLCDSNLAAAMIAAASPPPPPPPSTRTTSSSKGMDPSVYDMMKTMRAEKAAARASATAKKVKTEPGSDARGLSPFSGKKRSLEEANAKEGLSRSVPNTHTAAHGCSVSGACPRPPGFPTPNQVRKPQHVPDIHDGDTAEWEAARKLLQGILTPTRGRVFAAAKPSDVVASSYVSMLQAVNYASFSLGYTLELEEKLMAQERDAATEAGALRGELEKVKAEVAEAKKAAEAELESAKAAAVRELLASDEHVRRLADYASEGYERGMEHMKCVALQLCPHLDAARLVVPPGARP